MDKKYTSGSEYRKYRTKGSRFKGFRFWKYTPCPNITHNPKLFSWNQASQLCSDVNGTLPEFITREDEEEFTGIINQLQSMFPIDAVFIGLKSTNLKQVRLDTDITFICTSKLYYLFRNQILMSSD